MKPIESMAAAKKYFLADLNVGEPMPAAKLRQDETASREMLAAKAKAVCRRA